MVAVDACTARIADGIWKMPATLAATPLSLYFGYRGKLMRHAPFALFACHVFASGLRWSRSSLPWWLLPGDVSAAGSHVREHAADLLTKRPHVPTFDSTHFRIKISCELIFDGQEFHEVTPAQLLRQRRNNLFVDQ